MWSLSKGLTNSDSDLYSYWLQCLCWRAIFQSLSCVCFFASGGGQNWKAAESSQAVIYSVIYSLRMWNDPYSSFCEALIRDKQRHIVDIARPEQPQSGKRPHIADYFFQLTLLLKLCESGSQLVLLYLYIRWLFLFLSQNFSLHHVFRLFSVIADGVPSGVCRRSKNTWKRAQRVIQTSEWAAAKTCDITEPCRDFYGIYSTHYYNVSSDINTRTWTARVVPRRPTVCTKWTRRFNQL